MNVDKLLPYHSELNQQVWNGSKLDPKIRERLLEIAKKFEEFLDISDVKVYDIILTGSLANYNYTPKSDFDLHLVVDPREIDGDLAEKYLMAKKTIWNDNHDIKIKGHEVELYAQDVSEPHHSSGTYSLLNDRWLVKPKYEKPDINGLAVKIKATSMMKLIDSLIADPTATVDEVERLREKIRDMRRSGLAEKGEWSTENLVFKLLRNEGYLDRLWKFSHELLDRSMSLEDAAGVGIVTKQNTTQDVNPGTLRKMMKGLKLA